MIDDLAFNAPRCIGKDYFASAVERQSLMEATLTEEYIRLHVRRKPWWMPVWFYGLILGRFLVLERFVVHEKE